MKQTRFFLFALISFILYSCNQDENLVYNKNDTDENFIDNNEIRNIASLIGTPTTSTRSTQTLEIESITPMGDTQKPSYYIVNYKNNAGYVLLSGDDRTDPVLAYSTSGNFIINNEDMPTGLLEWMNNADEQIKEVRTSNDLKVKLRNSNPEINQQKIILVQRAFNNEQEEIGSIPDDPEPCIGWSETKGPLLKTQWGQGTGYNNFLGGNCSNYSNKKYPTGCVATAIAQIMKYHQHPKFYNWSGMPDTRGSDETSQLMQHIGRFLNMDYGCSGSSANTSDVPDVFKHTFSYKSASYSGYNYETVVREIASGYPVILSGGRKSDGLLPTYKDGHAWVCDGYRKTWVCASYMNYSTLYLHMN